MKYFLGLAMVLAAVVGGYLLWDHFLRPQPVAVTSQGPTVEKLEKLRELVSTRIYIADVLTATDAGYVGSWLIKGDALLGVDLSLAAFSEVDVNRQRAKLSLPAPRVITCRVDHERTKTWDIKSTSWLPWKGDQDRMRDLAMQEAQRLVQHVAATEENLSYSRHQAEIALRAFFMALNWDIEIVWRKP